MAFVHSQAGLRFSLWYIPKFFGNDNREGSE